jgi:hypothetical protein
MGFGLLFLGLDFMKESMDAMIKAFDFAPYLNYPRIVFVINWICVNSLNTNKCCYSGDSTKCLICTYITH